MPIRQGGILASRASTWPRDHFCRSTMAPRASWPTTWNEFLPISMPITAIAVLGVWDMACSLSLVPLAQLRLLAGQEHGRTIPLADSTLSALWSSPRRLSWRVLGPNGERRATDVVHRFFNVRCQNSATAALFGRYRVFVFFRINWLIAAQRGGVNGNPASPK